MTKGSENEGLPASPLLRLPFEIRLMIYEYLLFPSIRPSAGSGTSVANLLPDFHTCYLGDANSDPFTLNVRTIDAWMGAQGPRSGRRRSIYHVRTGKFKDFPLHSKNNEPDCYEPREEKRRDEIQMAPWRGIWIPLLMCLQGPFLTTTTPTTYRVLLSTYTMHLRHTVPSLLALNHQIHAEASKVLYSTYTFSFHTSIEAAVPFLSDLTPSARSHIRYLSLTKKGLPYTKEFDRSEWTSLCEYLAAHQSPSQPNVEPTTAFPFTLRTIHLNVIAGKPDLGWATINPITANDFVTMTRMRNDWGFGSLGGVDLDWAEQLMQIKGLQEIRIKALVEHCARPVSEKQAFWVAFSKSVEEGEFEKWLRGSMVEG